MKSRPNILTIAGFDPSGGAGVLADIKTFEQHKCLGFAVQTANTVQTESEFKSVNWVEQSLILDQLKSLTEKHIFKFAKIGLVESEDMLVKILEVLGKFSRIKIIWDPILKSSSGFQFHNKSFSSAALKRFFLITPNWEEVKVIGGDADSLTSARNLSRHCKVLLKGGHRPEQQGKDILFTDGKEFSFNPKAGFYLPKHGSGCVFSAALLSNLANGYPLNNSILRTKRYVEHFLNSSNGLTGYHRR